MVRAQEWHTELGKCLQVGRVWQSRLSEEGVSTRADEQPSAKGWGGRVRGQNSIQRRKSWSTTVDLREGPWLTGVWREAKKPKKRKSR